jgi:hypothetical protein
MANHNPRPLPPGPGRPKGSQNKATKDTKEALELAFQGAGGVAALTAWAKENPNGFYPIWAKLLPKNLDMTSKGDKLSGVIILPAEIPDV